MHAASGAGTSPLISVAELAGRLADPRLVVVDVRWQLGQPGAGRRAYAAGHLPGAIFLDLDEDLADPAGYGAPGRHPLPTPAAFAARLAQAGIGTDSFVVGYDDVGGWVAARLWWMLDVLGHRGGEAVLDGGWQAWLAAGRPTTTELPDRPAATQPPALATAWSRVIDRESLRGRLGEVILLDARAEPRYRGETEPIDPYPGHIPTAISAPWEGNVGPDGRMLPRDALRDRFDRLGAGAGAAVEVVASCGSGVTATQHALARRVAGLPDPTIYVGSYSDWSRSGLPVATGPEPGDAALARDAGAVRIEPLTDANWEPLAALFREGGDPRWCYCQFWRLRSKDFAQLHVPDLRERLHEQARSDRPPGLVALEASGDGSRSERAVGWVGFGPRVDFQRVVHSTVIPAIDDRPVWSIVCFASTPSARGRGLGRALLDAAVAYARDHGAPAIEAYPLDLAPDERISPAAAYTGTLTMFQRAGFRVVADNASDKTATHRRVVVRLEL